MSRLVVPSIALLALAACTAGQVAHRPESLNVEVGSNPPGQGYAQLGPITAKHGGGCGFYGAQGNYEGAMNILRNIAAERGADYVQIVSQQGERLLGLCLDRAYVIDGFAWKRTSTMP